MLRPYAPILLVLAPLAGAQTSAPTITPHGAAPVRFLDQAFATGTENWSFGRAAAMADLDGDGWLEILTADAGAPSSIFKRQPDGTYLDMYFAWGFPLETSEHWTSLPADYDNDGDSDIYALYGGFRYTGIANKMYRNDLDTSGRFTDVSGLSAAVTQLQPSFGGSCFDFDRDGLLDVFESNSGVSTTCTVLRNKGGMRFQDVTTLLGVTKAADFRHCGTGDINNDGWPDAGAGSFSGGNVLYRNTQGQFLVNIAAAAGVIDPGGNFGMVFTDFDNDGWMDIFLPKYNDRFDLAGSMLSRIYLNNADGTFRDVSSGSGLAAQEDMGHDAGDLDADGYPDIFIGTGAPERESYDPVHFVTPDGRGGIRAPNLARGAGLHSSGNSRCHGTAMGDLDRDGDIDVYCNNGGPSSLATREENFLWLSEGNDNNWIALDLVGVISNRSAVGTRSKAITGSGREVHRYHSVGRGFANTPMATQHFGLGTETVVDRIEVTWPSGLQQYLMSPALKSWNTMVETGLVVDPVVATGQPLTIQMVGPATERMDVFASPATTSIPLPSFGGVLELLPPWIPVVTKTIGASGVEFAQFGIPSDPTLGGVTVWFQGWAHPLGATNGGTLTKAVPTTIQ